MIERAARRIKPGTIIDVGASDGCWSASIRETWPDAHLLLIEANPVYKPRSDELNQQSGAALVWAVAGANEGQTRVKFFDDQPCQGIQIAPTGTPSRVTTIDAELARTKLPAPYFIKLDVHGHELMILEGARESLPQTCALLIETYLWEPRWGSPCFWELVPIMLRYGFRPTDLCDPCYRPSDGRCNAVDMLFEQSSAPGMDAWW
jgi:FkbM family methyltransferase